MRYFALSVFATAALMWGAITYAGAAGEDRGRAAAAAELDAAPPPVLLAQADDVPHVGPAAAMLFDAGPVPAVDPVVLADHAEPTVTAPRPAPPAVTDPTSDPLAAVDLVVSLARRGYLAAVAHLVLFWLGLAALARWAWLVKRAPWLARGRVLVFVSGLVANLVITAPAAAAGTATWGGLGLAAFGALLLWLQPIVTKLAGGQPATAGA